MFDQLTRLAHDRSPAHRAELLAAIINLYAATGHHADAEIEALYADIVAHLLPQVGRLDRIETACRVAAMPTTPPELIQRLARAELDLAAPVLRYSTQLSDADLADLVAVLPRGHRIAIAARAPLSEPVTDALLLDGDPVVRSVVIRNPSARLSAAALGRLVGDAGGEMADRGHRPSATVLSFPLAEAAVRRRRPGEVGSVVPFRAPGPGEGAASGSACPPVAAVIAEIASDERMLEVATLLAEHAGLPANLVCRLIARADATLFAMLCKAAGVPAATFATIAGIRGGRFGHSTDAIERLARGYDALSAGEAEKALRFLKARLPVKEPVR